MFQVWHNFGKIIEYSDQWQHCQHLHASIYTNNITFDAVLLSMCTTDIHTTIEHFVPAATQTLDPYRFDVRWNVKCRTFSWHNKKFTNSKCMNLSWATCRNKTFANTPNEIQQQRTPLMFDSKLFAYHNKLHKINTIFYKCHGYLGLNGVLRDRSVKKCFVCLLDIPRLSVQSKILLAKH